jgi:hypothetical protein
MDRCRCDLCGQTFPRALIHEHHVIKRASGGRDTVENIITLDASCHNAVHQVEMALKNQNRRGTASELAASMFPGSMEAQRRCLELAVSAALASNAPKAPADYSAFDTKDLVHLTPPKVSPKVRDLVGRVTRETLNPKTGKKLGVGEYLRLLVEADLRKRGYSF